MNSKQKTIYRKCDECQTLYKAEQRYLNRGQGRFCSRSCAGTYNAKLQYPQEPNCICDYCGTDFYRRPSEIREGLKFCSRKCKDTAQRIENGFEELWPEHYNKAKSSYRIVAFRNYAHCCNRCGYDEQTEILEVHHKDRNRENNKLDNLEILCPNCHAVEHRI